MLGRHKILCGNSLEGKSYQVLLGSEKADMVFTDPPYNVAVQGHVRSSKDSGHREFAMASGEMTDGQFQEFLETMVVRLNEVTTAKSISMICMDWRHIDQLIGAGKSNGLDFLNLCVWNKNNGGMGGLYRSKHELVTVWRKPGTSTPNNVQLGRYGRNRTNVWDFPGVNSFGKGRKADLVDHPTVKPTALVAEAILDVTKPGDLVLDIFGGSGSTILAAEKTKRTARLVELDPSYVDVALRRWAEMTGKQPVLQSSGKTLNQVKQERLEGLESD